MDNQILSEETNKIKTKVFIFSGVSLFIGLTKTLPTKIAIIGLDFQKNEKVLGWFLFAITTFLLLYFIIIASLNIIKYFKNYFIAKKTKILTGDIIGLTYEEIGEEYVKQEEFFNYEPSGTLSEETQNIEMKIKYLEDTFNKNHLSISNIIEILFNYIIPIFLAIISLTYLYSFLSKC